MNSRLELNEPCVVQVLLCVCLGAYLNPCRGNPRIPFNDEEARKAEYAPCVQLINPHGFTHLPKETPGKHAMVNTVQSL
jgi:hypothetical protein